MGKLQQTGRRYESSKDMVELVGAVMKMRKRVTKEIGKRRLTVPIPQRIHDLSDAIARVGNRFNNHNLSHFESEEGYLKEFGEWLIATHAAITGTQGAKWELVPSALRVNSLKIQPSK